MLDQSGGKAGQSKLGKPSRPSAPAAARSTVTSQRQRHPREGLYPVPALVVWTTGGDQNQGPTAGQPVPGDPHIYKDRAGGRRWPLGATIAPCSHQPATCTANIYRVQSRFQQTRTGHTILSQGRPRPPRRQEEIYIVSWSMSIDVLPGALLVVWKTTGQPAALPAERLCSTYHPKPSLLQQCTAPPR